MDGVVIPSKTWHRMGIYAEHIISTDNGRHADPESKMFVIACKPANRKPCGCLHLLHVYILVACTYA